MTESLISEGSHVTGYAEGSVTPSLREWNVTVTWSRRSGADGSMGGGTRQRGFGGQPAGGRGGEDVSL